MSSRHDALIARNITKSYGETVVLDGLSLAVTPSAGSASSARTGSASRRCCACSPASRSRTPGRSSASRRARASPTSCRSRAVRAALGRRGGEGDLEAILAADADVLLLDEPTNDLDFAGLELLERFVGSHCGGSSPSRTTAPSSSG